MQRDLMLCPKGLQYLFSDRKTCLVGGVPCVRKAFHGTHWILTVLHEYSTLLPSLKLQEAERLHKIIFVPFALMIPAFVVDMFAFCEVYVSDIKKSEIPVMIMHVITVITNIFKSKVLLVNHNHFYTSYFKMLKQNSGFETVK